MTDPNSEKAEALLKEGGEKLHEAQAPPAETGERPPALADAVADAYRALDAGEEHENLTLRDRHLSALVAGLDEADQLTGLGEAAADALDRDADPETRADVLRLLLRYAVADLDSDILDATREGLRAYQDEQAESVI